MNVFSSDVNLPLSSSCVNKDGRNFMFSSEPLLASNEGIRRTEFKTAVGPILSRPYIGDIPPSAKGVRESRPSADAPTLNPMGTCADTVYKPMWYLPPLKF